VDVRVVAATGVDLAQAVAQREFREDLYYRLRVVPIEVPPLRERREDLDLLIRHLLERIGKARGRALRLAPSAMRALLSYRWPGNVRELENALEYATTVCEGQTIHLRDLPVEVGSQDGQGRPPSDPVEPIDLSGTEDRSIGGGSQGGSPRPSALAGEIPFSAEEAEEIERIRSALEKAQYRREEAASLLGMSRTTLWRKMKEYRL
jgi:DNA-binding NtrC family response regulator